MKIFYKVKFFFDFFSKNQYNHNMIHIIHIADGHKHFEKAINEYQKRLGKNITIHTIRPIKHTDINFIKNTETAKILEKLTKIR